MSFYLANDKYATTLNSGYTVGQTTLSVNVVPDNVPTLVVVAKGTTKETVFIVTGKTINSLTGVSRLKGYNGDLDVNMPVTCLNNAEFLNQYAVGFGVEDWITETYNTNMVLNIDSEAGGGKKHFVELAGNTTFTLANVSNGDIFMVAVKQGTSGNWLVTWFPGAVWVDGVAPTLTTTVGKVDTFIFVELLGSYYGYVCGMNS